MGREQMFGDKEGMAKIGLLLYIDQHSRYVMGLLNVVICINRFSTVLYYLGLLLTLHVSQ